MESSVFALHTRPAPDGWSWLFGEEPVRRRVLQRMLVAYVLLLGLHGLRGIGLAMSGRTLDTLWLPAVVDLLWMGTCLAAVRSGRTAHRRDPALTTAQVALSLGSVVLAFIWVDAGRAAAAPLAGTLLALALPYLSARAVLGLGAATVLLLATATAGLDLVSAPDLDTARTALGIGVLAACLPGLAWAAHRSGQIQLEQQQQRSALQDALTRLDALTTQDELTGLSNHRHMQDVLLAECKRHHRSGRPFCIALLDIDALGDVNERHGRTQGDDVIRQLGRVATAHLRTSDVMARWSGEEFLILMPETPLDGGMRSIERLREHLRTRWGYYHEGRWVPMNASVGLTSYRAGEALPQMLQRVERALRDAQARGRDQVVSA